MGGLSFSCVNMFTKIDLLMLVLYQLIKWNVSILNSVNTVLRIPIFHLLRNAIIIIMLKFSMLSGKKLAKEFN